MNAEEFGKMGFKQQQIYAEAIGMSRDELQNQLITQQKNEEMIGKYGETGSKVMGFISERRSQYQVEKNLLPNLLKSPLNDNE